LSAAFQGLLASALSIRIRRIASAATRPKKWPVWPEIFLRYPLGGEVCGSS
jgi:hypothetical protein